jgi:hypothetical protein
MPLRASVLNSGPFPRPALPGFLGTTGLSATPSGPAWPSRASGWGHAPTARGFPCCVGSPLLACRRHYPGGTAGSGRFSGCNPRLPSSCGLPRFCGGSAPTSRISRPARRSLALRPACSRSRLSDPLHRRLRRSRCLHRRSDCYRLERPSCRAGVAPAEDPSLSTAHTKSYAKGRPRGVAINLSSGCHQISVISSNFAVVRGMAEN